MSLPEAAADREALAAHTRADAHDFGGDEMLRLVQRLFLSTRNVAVPRQVVFCGIGNENGSSTVCAYAGKTLAVRSTRPVCVVDANRRSSRLTDVLGGTTVAIGNKPATVREQCVEIRENLWLAGTELLADEVGGLASAFALKERLTELRGMFEFVLIDAPGADISGDAAILGQTTDGVILVIDAEATRRIAARKVKESLDTANVRLLGAVLNGRSFPIPKGLYSKL